MQITRRSWLKVVASGGAVGVLTACGGAGGGASPATSAPAAAVTVQSAAAQAATAVAPTSAPAAAAGSGTAAAVQVGYVPVLVYSPLFVAQERGYFKDAGIDAKLLPIQGGSEAVVQLAAGNFDAAVGGAGAGVFNAANQGVKFKFVAPMHSEKPPLATKLVISAKRKTEFANVAALKGKTVAINAAGAATEYWLDQALSKNGLTFADITLKTVAFRDVPAALESGSLDAAMLGEPLVTINAQKGIVSILADDFINGFTATYLYMGEPLLSGKPTVAEGFMNAYLRACRDLQGNYMTPELAAIIEKYTQVPAAVVQKASLGQYDPNGTMPIKDLETLQSYFLGRGVLQYKDLLPIPPLVDTTLAAKVAASLK